jgi:hypothetical protein
MYLGPLQDTTPNLISELGVDDVVCDYYLFISHLLTTFQIVPLLGSQGSKTKVKVRLQLNLHGIFSIDSARVSKKFHFTTYHFAL